MENYGLRPAEQAPTLLDMHSGDVDMHSADSFRGREFHSGIAIPGAAVQPVRRSDARNSRSAPVTTMAVTRQSSGFIAPGDPLTSLRF